MSGLIDETCNDCIFRAGLSGSGSYCCNYILDTGHPRGCKPGKGCKRRVTKGKIKRVRRIPTYC